MMYEIEMPIVGYNEDGLIIDGNGIPFTIPNVDIEKLNKRLIEAGKKPLKRIKIVRR